MTTELDCTSKPQNPIAFISYEPVSVENQYDLGRFGGKHSTRTSGHRKSDSLISTDGMKHLSAYGFHVQAFILAVLTENPICIGRNGSEILQQDEVPN